MTRLWTVVQIIDPQQGFTIPTTHGQLSVDSSSNPQDIAFVHANKAYVSRLASARLLIINPIHRVKVGASLSHAGQG